MFRIITGETGGLNVHSEDDGALHAGVFGTDDYVLDVGNKFNAEIQSSNQIKIYDGDAIIQGRHGRISENDFELVTINNGSQGNNRIDLICIRYSKLANVESMEMVVIEGTETTGVPVVPAHNSGNILTGANKREFVLYEVRLTGTSITSITPKFTILQNMTNLRKEFSGVSGLLMQYGRTIITTSTTATATKVNLAEGFSSRPTVVVTLDAGTFWTDRVKINVSDLSTNSFSINHLATANGTNLPVMWIAVGAKG